MPNGHQGSHLQGLGRPSFEPQQHSTKRSLRHLCWLPSQPSRMAVLHTIHQRLISSVDASFNEDFASVSALTDSMYTGSMPAKPLPQSFDAKTGFAHTGPPLYLSDHHQDDQDEAGQWKPYTIIEPEHEVHAFPRMKHLPWIFTLPLVTKYSRKSTRGSVLWLISPLFHQHQSFPVHTLNKRLSFNTT